MKLVDLLPGRPSVAERRISALDGLRGFAAVAVMAYHFRVSIGGVQLLRGGFVGVDLFFVLSGFLIGSLIVGEVGRTGRVGLVAFWSRRFRRLLPASAVLLVAVCIWGATVGWGRAISDDVVASAFWFQNWHLINVGQSYWGRVGPASPLEHFWSLSIEEQWYVVFPIAALLCRKAIRRRPKLITAALVVGAVISAIAMGILHQADPQGSRAYFGTDTRVFALMLGAAASFWPRASVAAEFELERRKWRFVMVGGGLVWLVAAILATEQASFMYRGGFLVVALASLAAVVGAARSRTTWMDATSLQWLGSRSYGLYLWHWPINLALTSALIGFGGWPLIVVKCLATGAITELSFRVVERPIRSGRWSRRGGAWILPIGLTLSSFVCLLAITLPEDSTKPFDFEQVAKQLDDLENTATSTAPPNTATTGNGPAPIRVGVFGDSLALMVRLGLGGDQRIILTAGSAKLGCPLGRTGDVRGSGATGDRPGGQIYPVKAECDWTGVWHDTAVTTSMDVAVVLIGYWDIGGRRIPMLGNSWTTIGEPTYDDWLESEIAAVADELHANGGVDNIVWLTLPGIAGEPVDTRVAAWNALVEQAASTRPWITIADFAGYLRDSGNDTSSRPDGIHLTVEASKELATSWLNEVIVAANTS